MPIFRYGSFHRTGLATLSGECIHLVQSRLTGKHGYIRLTGTGLCRSGVGIWYLAAVGCQLANGIVVQKCHFALSTTKQTANTDSDWEYDQCVAYLLDLYQIEYSHTATNRLSGTDRAVNTLYICTACLLACCLAWVYQTDACISGSYSNFLQEYRQYIPDET